MPVENMMHMVTININGHHGVTTYSDALTARATGKNMQIMRQEADLQIGDTLAKLPNSLLGCWCLHCGEILSILKTAMTTIIFKCDDHKYEGDDLRSNAENPPFSN